MLFFICILTLAQAYVVKWIIPTYEMLSNQKTTVIPDTSRGYLYLLILAFVLIALASTILVIAKKKTQKPTLVN